MYDTNQVWNDLATTGRAHIITSLRNPTLAQQLREEAFEEGVSVKIDFKRNARGSYSAYVYLRKSH